jgi:hypothetical protein
MTPEQQRVYDACTANHDALRAIRSPLGSFSRCYNLGYNYPSTPANQNPRPLSSSMADAAFRAGRDRRRADERHLRRAVRRSRDLAR